MAGLVVGIELDWGPEQEVKRSAWNSRDGLHALEPSNGLSLPGPGDLTLLLSVVVLGYG